MYDKIKPRYDYHYWTTTVTPEDRTHGPKIEDRVLY